MPLLPASPPPETEEGGEREPIKTVNTFWERLDEVLINLEETKDLSATASRPFLNQPDRVFISSQDYISPTRAVLLCRALYLYLFKRTITLNHPIINSTCVYRPVDYESPLYRPSVKQKLCYITYS
jgi:hypothetical protein